MLCVRASFVVLVLAVMMAGAAANAGAAQEATPATTPAAKPQQPTQPTSGPGSSEALFGGMTMLEQIPSGELEADYWLFVPSDPLPGSTAATEPLPLVIFVHSYMTRDPVLYLGWIEHLVRRGAIVVFPEYEEDATDDAGYRQNLLDDVRSALDTLQREEAVVDLHRVAVTGHSLGGALAADYAASAAAAGLPVPAAVMSVAPGCVSDVKCPAADLGTVPSTTRVLLVIEADDSDPTGGGAVESI
jgi:acetyl esterase/lipase